MPEEAEALTVQVQVFGPFPEIPDAAVHKFLEDVHTDEGLTLGELSPSVALSLTLHGGDRPGRLFCVGVMTSETETDKPPYAYVDQVVEKVLSSIEGRYDTQTTTSTISFIADGDYWDTDEDPRDDATGEVVRRAQENGESRPFRAIATVAVKDGELWFSVLDDPAGPWQQVDIEEVQGDVLVYLLAAAATVRSRTANQ